MEKQCTKCNIIKKLNEFNKHKSSKDGLQWECSECTRIYQAKYRKNNPDILKKWYKSNPGKTKVYCAKYRKNNPGKIKTCIDRWVKANPDKVNDKNTGWRKKNPEKIKKAGITWNKNNPGKANAQAAKRRCAKLRRTPKWLTESDWIEIKWAYKIAKDRTKETKIKHVVDHIVPLQGKNVSGLHVPQNLQILTDSENSSKGNRFNGK